MTEQKRSAHARLEETRTTRFLLGMVVVLSAFFVAMEWNSHPEDFDLDERLLDDVTEELLVSSWDADEQVAVVVAEQPRPQPGEQVKVVEVVPDEVATTEPFESAAPLGEAEDLGREAPPSEPWPPVSSALDDEPLSVRIVEQLPEFPGGMSAFINWLSKNLTYPPEAAREKLRGRVVVSFVVNRDGTISDEKVVHAASPVLDAEAMRVVRLMPRWKPGVQNNRPCRTMVAVPVVFEP